MIQVKEFSSEMEIEKPLNDWLYENQDKKIIDIKYSADQFSANAMVIYEEDNKDGAE